MTINQELGLKIKSLRRSAQITQSMMAERLGLSVRYLQKMESGKIDFKLSFLNRFSKIFDIPLKYMCPIEDQDFDLFSALDGMQVGIQVADKNGRILYVNQLCSKMQGYSRQEMCKKFCVWDLASTQKEQDSLKKYIRYLVKDKPEPTPYVAVNKTKSGKIVKLIINWNYICSKDDEVIGFFSVINYL